MATWYGNCSIHWNVLETLLIGSCLSAVGPYQQDFNGLGMLVTRFSCGDVPSTVDTSSADSKGIVPT